ncbi:MAG TPA: SDR family oxidoreductase [Acidimicrobiales bacterium]
MQVGATGGEGEGMVGDGRETRRAIVTGASTGIGAEVARRLAAGGAELWLTYASDEAGAAHTVEACRAEGVAVRASRLDLRSIAAIDAFAAEVRDGWGYVNVVVNNAAICPWTPWDEITPDEWDAVLETNLRGPFRLLQQTVPLVRVAPGDRSIVNLASVAGQTGGIATSVHYAASKGGVLALTRSFARLLAPEGIRVNAVAPGPVRTAMTDALDDERRAGLASGVPLGRFGTVAEVAAAVALLASPEAGFTTGATYDVNGGLRID